MSKTIVITGCSTGFGRDLAEQLARKGHRVYATMRGVGGKNAEVAGQMSDIAKSEQLDLHVVELDVTSTESVDAAAAVVLESGAPDIVINNAGQMYVGITEAFDADEFARQLDINVVGIHRVNRALLPAMRAQGSGLVINFSSVAGRFGAPFFGVYNASKWAVEGYSAAMRVELASSGVDVVVVEPGPFSTQLFPRSPAPSDADGRAATYPQPLHATREEMGAAFEGMFEDPEVPTDPQMVVDSTIQLCEMTPGTRPLRTVVGVNFGIAEMNAAVEPFEDGIHEAFGLKEIGKLRVAGEV